MSGEAGAHLESDYYELSLGSGVYVNIAIRPDGTGSEVGDYFAAASQPFERWLERARPRLDALFQELLAEGRVPLAPRAERYEEIDGVIDDDAAPRAEELAAHFHQHAGRGPFVVRLVGSPRQLGLRSLRLAIQVARRTKRAELDRIVERVTEILRATEEERSP